MNGEDKAMVETSAGMLRLPESLTDRLDRQIAQAEAHLSNLKDARQLIKDNPILQQFHDALRKVGF